MTYEPNRSRIRHDLKGPTRSQTATAERRRTAILVTVLAVSILLTLLVQLPQLGDRYRVEKDVQNFYWMARYQDPDLFPVDHLTWGNDAVVEVSALGYRLPLLPRSLGYGLLFWLGSFLIDHVWMAKLIGFILMPISVAYVFKLGESIADEYTGAALSLLSVFIILASPRPTAITTGVQRAFSIPLLVVFTYYLHQKRYWPAGAMIFISLLFYYPNFLIAALTYVLALVEVKRPCGIHMDLSHSKLIPLLLAVVLSLGVIALTVVTEPSRVLPKDVAVSQDARYQPGGAMPLLAGFPWTGRAGVFECGEILLNFLTLTAVAGLILARLGKASLQRIPPVFGRLLLGSIVLYATSLFVRVELSSGALYLPSRYTRSTLIWVVLGFVGVNLQDFVDGIGLWLGRNYRLVVFFIVSLATALTASFSLLSVQLADPARLLVLGLILGGPLVVLGTGAGQHIARLLVEGEGGRRRTLWSLSALVLILAVSAPTGWFYVDTLAAETIDPSATERDVYSFIGKLPKDAMIAGNPHVMVGVPLFAERSVLFRELSPREDAPVVEFFDAYYAESPETMVAFCRRHEVNYLVIDHADFAPDYVEEGAFFYEPYNEAIVELVAGRSDFVAPELQPTFTSGSLAVIPCDSQMILGGG